MNNKVLVVYFSGTGGTKRIASSFQEKFSDRKFDVTIHSLDKTEYELLRDNYKELINSMDLIILLYPVYATDAPILIFEWINDLPSEKKISTVVISVSGGGDIWPNTSCRVNVIKALENKNYDVVYEKMMIMPANVLVAVNDHVTMYLLNCIPKKVNKIVSDVLEGKKLRDGIHISTRGFSMMHMEKRAKNIGKYFKAKDNCTACGWCAKNCPRGNLYIQNNKLKFGNSCVGCFRCIYGCPSKSICFGKGKRIVLKDGFDIDEVEKRMRGVPLEPVEKCCKGLWAIGVKNIFWKMNRMVTNVK